MGFEAGCVVGLLSDATCNIDETVSLEIRVVSPCAACKILVAIAL